MAISDYGGSGLTSCQPFPKGKIIFGTQREVVERRSKRGKTFYGCNRYPDCSFVAWGKPVAEKCPECGSAYLVEKWLKAGPTLQCTQCKFKKDMPPPAPATEPKAEEVGAR